MILLTDGTREQERLDPGSIPYNQDRHPTRREVFLRCLRGIVLGNRGVAVKLRRPMTIGQTVRQQVCNFTGDLGVGLEAVEPGGNHAIVDCIDFLFGDGIETFEIVHHLEDFEQGFFRIELMDRAGEHQRGRTVSSREA